MAIPTKKRSPAPEQPKSRPRTFDECLKDHPAKMRELAQELRRLVKQQVPEAKESVNAWGIPAFSLVGSFAFFLIAKPLGFDPELQTLDSIRKVFVLLNTPESRGCQISFFVERGFASKSVNACAE